MEWVSAFVIATTLGLAGCNEVSAEPLREGLATLNDLEDRAFAMAQIDGAGRFVVVTPIEDLQAVAKKARSTVLPGCLGKARGALVASIDQIIRSQEAGSGDTAMAEAWKRVTAYQDAAETCELALTS